MLRFNQYVAFVLSNTICVSVTSLKGLTQSFENWKAFTEISIVFSQSDFKAWHPKNAR